MEVLYKMNISLLGPKGKDYRQPKARNHGKLSSTDLVAKNIRGHLSLEVCSYTLDNLLALMSQMS